MKNVDAFVNSEITRHCFTYMQSFLFVWSTFIAKCYTYCSLEECLKFYTNILLFLASQIVGILKLLISRTFLYLLFGYPMANFEPLSMGQTHSTNVNHYVFVNFLP